MPEPRSGRVRAAVLISGAGSNMAALIDAARADDCPFEVVLVVSNKPDAGGLAVARDKGVAVAVVDHRPFGKDREAHEKSVDALLRAQEVEVVALAGYMRLLTPWLVRRWEGRMLNIHPSLLPKYPGLDTHARALAAGDVEAGCTVHLVTEGVDEGPILAQATVPVLADDIPASLAQRVLTAEHNLYPRALADFCRRR
ncbi:MAG: phosphoribosylglycinamide formyltransferase [Brevundimonas sp.]|uniref:phosphoribosylglycinamide formyltransferase n=1 Tax=Brevundimonas sp. TaxID=1871086 RepID=UPI00261C9C2A|nr:phosphoribosylglycinamide formyltransferase [Brevundimonas sp.]MDI6624973.1 phosphoribosylglycinamide formyltransferase [Brevundimonas sp.]MDQ7811547.1 phosphoribosylglycinamide formyltransferase [Brevundimonas sp.]